MRVLIDADGCPVVSIAVDLCKKAAVRCILFCDTAHNFNRVDAEIIIADQGANSVDYAIANNVLNGDVVITQDYGLACLCLSRNAVVLHQDGWKYTTENIDALLTVRHEAQKQRINGGRFKGPKKRTKQQDVAFEASLKKLLAH